MRRRQAGSHAGTVTGSIWRVQRVRRRSERGALRFRDLAWSKPLGPNRIKRLGYYRPRSQRATEARETNSAFFFFHLSRLYARIPARQTPMGVKSAPARQRLLTAGCCGCIYSFSSVRSNHSGCFSLGTRCEKNKTKNKGENCIRQPLMEMKCCVMSRGLKRTAQIQTPALPHVRVN